MWLLKSLMQLTLFFVGLAALASGLATLVMALAKKCPWRTVWLHFGLSGASMVLLVFYIVFTQAPPGTVPAHSFAAIPSDLQGAVAFLVPPALGFVYLAVTLASAWRGRKPA